MKETGALSLSLSLSPEESSFFMLSSPLESTSEEGKNDFSVKKTEKKLFPL